MEQGHFLVGTGFSIDNPVETTELETISISSVSTVHDVAES